MRNFTYNNSTTIIFGKDTQKNVGQETKKYGHNEHTTYER